MPYVNGKWEDPTCEICGEPIGDRRYGARFCGQNCRKAASRKKLLPARHGNAVINQLQQLRMLVKPVKTDPALAKDVADWLKRIQAECKDILVLCDPEAKRDHADLVEMVNRVANKRR